MIKWLIDHAKVIGIGLAVVISVILVPALAYLTGLLILGYGLWRVFHMGYDDGGRAVQVQRGRQPEICREGDMISNKTRTRQSINGLDEQITVPPRESREEMPSWLPAGLTSFFGILFSPPKKKSKPKFLSDELTNAALKCQEQTDNERFDVKTITKALEEFNAEGASLTAQNQTKHVVSTPGYFQAVTITEQSVLTTSKSKEECNQLLVELHDLMGNYPQCAFEANPCIESIESYAEERGAHHEKILAIAIILLPNLSSLLNEAKAVCTLRMSA